MDKGPVKKSRLNQFLDTLKAASDGPQFNKAPAVDQNAKYTEVEGRDAHVKPSVKAKNMRVVTENQENPERDPHGDSLPSILNKAQGKIPKRITVTRNGKTYATTVYVNPNELDEKEIFSSLSDARQNISPKDSDFIRSVGEYYQRTGKVSQKQREVLERILDRAHAQRHNEEPKPLPVPNTVEEIDRELEALGRATVRPWTRTDRGAQTRINLRMKELQDAKKGMQEGHDIEKASKRGYHEHDGLPEHPVAVKDHQEYFSNAHENKAPKSVRQGGANELKGVYIHDHMNGFQSHTDYGSRRIPVLWAVEKIKGNLKKRGIDVGSDIENEIKEEVFKQGEYTRHRIRNPFDSSVMTESYLSVIGGFRTSIVVADDGRMWIVHYKQSQGIGDAKDEDWDFIGIPDDSEYAKDAEIFKQKQPRYDKNGTPTEYERQRRNDIFLALCDDPILKEKTDFVRRIPADHLRRVNKIKGDNLNGQVVKDAEVVWGKKAGQFAPRESSIDIDYEIGGEKTLVHEVGHAVHLSSIGRYLGYELHEEIRKSYNQSLAKHAGFPSEYSKRNENEFFAECYATYVLHPEELKVRNPRMYKVMQKVFKHLSGSDDMFLNYGIVKGEVANSGVIEDPIGVGEFNPNLPNLQEDEEEIEKAANAPGYHDHNGSMRSHPVAVKNHEEYFAQRHGIASSSKDMSDTFSMGLKGFYKNQKNHIKGVFLSLPSSIQTMVSERVKEIRINSVIHAGGKYSRGAIDISPYVYYVNKGDAEKLYPGMTAAFPDIVVAHEMGHAVEDFLNLSTSDEKRDWNAITYPLARDADKHEAFLEENSITEYGKNNLNEFFAEYFVYYLYGRDYMKSFAPQEIYAFFQKLFGDTDIAKAQTRKVQIGIGAQSFEHEKTWQKIIASLEQEQDFLSDDISKAIPPRPGLVPQSGDPQHPYRWVRSDNSLHAVGYHRTSRDAADSIKTGGFNLNKIEGNIPGAWFSDKPRMKSGALGGGLLVSDIKLRNPIVAADKNELNSKLHTYYKTAEEKYRKYHKESDGFVDGDARNNIAWWVRQEIIQSGHDGAIVKNPDDSGFDAVVWDEKSIGDVRSHDENIYKSNGIPPRAGLVPQSGDPQHPVHWVLPEGSTDTQDIQDADSHVNSIKNAIKAHSELGKALDVLSAVGQPYLVGGGVRDAFLGIKPKDFDIEMFGVEPEELEKVLRERLDAKGEQVGKHFGVFKVGNLDVSLPRKETKTGEGHKGFDVQPDPHLAPQDAARRRDFNFNALMYDVKSGKVLDFYGGIDALKNKVIRHVDAQTFVEDSLRVYRAAQFAARFGFTIAPETVKLARSMDLSSLPKERVYEEFKKLLLKSPKPSVGIKALDDMGVLERYYPELHRMKSEVQHPGTHAEGDVLTHSNMTLDKAVEATKGMNEKDKLIVMLGALLHDTGKPVVSKTKNGHVSHGGHEAGGVEPARNVLERLTNEPDVIDDVLFTVESHHELLEHNHLVPVHYAPDNTDEKEFIKLINKYGMRRLEILAAVTQADSTGRLTRQADGTLKEPSNHEIIWFRDTLKRVAAKNGLTSTGKIKPLISGSDILDMGIKEGRDVGRIMRDVQEQQESGKLSSKDAAIDYVRGKYVQKSAETAEAFIQKADIKYSVKAVIQLPNEDVLIMKDKYSENNKDGGWWDVPGGHVDENETTVAALRREIKEESGLTFLGCEEVFTRVVKTNETKPITFYRIKAWPDQKDKVRLSEEHTEYRWVAPENLQDYNLGVFLPILQEVCGVDIEIEKGQPPRQGLVPKSGDYEHPDRWVRPEESMLPNGLISTEENKSIEWVKVGKYYVNKEPLVLYHGTRSVNKDKIQSEGLKYGNLTPSKQYAEEIASKIRTWDGEPIVFEVHAPAGSIYPVFHGPKWVSTDALSLVHPIKDVRIVSTDIEKVMAIPAGMHLVPQTGDWRHPGHWVKPQQEEPAHHHGKHTHTDLSPNERRMYETELRGNPKNKAFMQELDKLNIPHREKYEIARTALTRGTVAFSDLPVPQRVRIAVIAHVRHKHTDYDEMLSMGGERDKVREKITPHINNVLQQWGLSPTTRLQKAEAFNTVPIDGRYATEEQEDDKEDKVEKASPRPGLVPASGNYAHPGRWILPGSSGAGGGGLSDKEKILTFLRDKVQPVVTDEQARRIKPLVEEFRNQQEGTQEYEDAKDELLDAANEVVGSEERIEKASQRGYHEHDGFPEHPVAVKDHATWMNQNGSVPTAVPQQQQATQKPKSVTAEDKELSQKAKLKRQQYDEYYTRLANETKSRLEAQSAVDEQKADEARKRLNIEKHPLSAKETYFGFSEPYSDKIGDEVKIGAYGSGAYGKDITIRPKEMIVQEKERTYRYSNTEQLEAFLRARYNLGTSDIEGVKKEISLVLGKEPTEEPKLSDKELTRLEPAVKGIADVLSHVLKRRDGKIDGEKLNSVRKMVDSLDKNDLVSLAKYCMTYAVNNDKGIVPIDTRGEEYSFGTKFPIPSTIFVHRLDKKSVESIVDWYATRHKAQIKNGVRRPFGFDVIKEIYSFGPTPEIRNSVLDTLSKHGLGGFLLVGTKREGFRGRVFSNWLFASGTNDSIWLMRTVDRHFNKTDKTIHYWSGDKGNPFPRTLIEPDEEYFGFVQDVYKETQDYYARRNVETVTVYRGVRGNVTTNSPLESWSLDVRTAKRFNGGGGEILKITVPRDRIFMSYKAQAVDWEDEKQLKGKQEITLIGIKDGKSLFEEFEPELVY